MKSQVLLRVSATPTPLNYVHDVDHSDGLHSIAYKIRSAHVGPVAGLPALYVNVLDNDAVSGSLSETLFHKVV